MTRVLGLTMAIVLSLSLESTAHAQGSFNYGGSAYPNTYGGLGLNYSQTVGNGGMVMDRFGMWHGVPYVEAAPVVAPAPVQPRTTRSMRSTFRRKVAQPRYQLPTGSLGTLGNGGMLYAPASRYASYGSGYGVGPYGTIDHSAMWHGMPMGW